MGYFPVRYDSRVIIYDRRGFIRLATGVAQVKITIGTQPGIASRYLDHIFLPAFKDILRVKLC